MCWVVGGGGKVERGVECRVVVVVLGRKKCEGV